MLENPATLQALVFYGAVVTLALIEMWPRVQRQTVAIGRRWPTNLGLYVLNVAIVAIVPLSALAVAERAGPGVFDVLPVDTTFKIVLGILVLDFWKYVEHRFMHGMTTLWRVHLVHHSDVEVDFTTTERHHPIEVAISILSLFAVIYVFAIPVVAVAVFAMTAGVVALISHANIRLPDSIDRMLRAVLVTPAMHMVHHSAAREETDSNYGLIFSVWDRMFGTYREPRLRGGGAAPTLGLESFRSSSDARLDRVLCQPFSFQLPVRTASVAQRTWRPALAGIALGLVILLVVFRSTCAELISVWSSNASYTYAWAVLPTLAYLLWSQRDRFSACTPGWSVAGLAGTAICACAWLFADLAHLAVGRQLALVLAIWCLVLSAVGWRVFARVAPFLTLLILLVPSGDVLLPIAKALTVKLVALASLTGLPYRMDGNVIYAGPNRYVVIDDCAGLPYVLTMLFLGWTFGLLMYRSAWKVGAFALLGAACGIVANSARIVTIVIIDWVNGSTMELASHVYSERVAFAVALVVLIIVMARLKADVQQPSGSVQPPAANARSFLAPVFASVLAVSLTQVARAHTHIEGIGPVPVIASGLLPERLGDWTKQGEPPSWTPAPRTPMLYARAQYGRADREMAVFIAAIGAANGKVTGNSIDLTGQDHWLEQARHRGVECTNRACGEVSALTLTRKKDVRQIYYVYALGEEPIGSPLALQLKSAWSTLVGNPAPARIIAVAADGEPPLSPAEAVDVLSALVSSPTSR